MSDKAGEVEKQCWHCIHRPICHLVNAIREIQDVTPFLKMGWGKYLAEACTHYEEPPCK